MFEDAAEYVRRERPVVVRGAVREWPPCKWTPAYLKALNATSTVQIGVSQKEAGYLNDAERLSIGDEREASFAQTIDAIFAPANPEQKCRIDQKPLKRWAALDEESPPIPYVLGKAVVKNIWAATTGSITKTHYDTENNINVQVLGRKEIVLFPSAQLDELYPRSVWDYRSNFSRVEIETPDLSRYPRFSRATPLRAILEPGDFIYIPIYWWHQFYTLEASLNVNFFWGANAEQALRRHGLRCWPRMARGLYLHQYIAGLVRTSIESLSRG